MTTEIVNCTHHDRDPIMKVGDSNHHIATYKLHCKFGVGGSGIFQVEIDYNATYKEYDFPSSDDATYEKKYGVGDWSSSYGCCESKRNTSKLQQRAQFQRQDRKTESAGTGPASATPNGHSFSNSSHKSFEAMANVGWHPF